LNVIALGMQDQLKSAEGLQKLKPPPVRTVEEGREHYAAWLEYPPGNPLRLIAENRLRELAARCGGPPASPAGPARGAFRGLPRLRSWRPPAPGG
jgi:hypothetical protein